MSYVNFASKQKGSASKGSIRAKKLMGINTSKNIGGGSLSRAADKSNYETQQMPGTLNMIRSSYGEIGKRPGYKLMDKPPELRKITGAYAYESDGVFTTYAVCENVVFSFVLGKEYYKITQLPNTFSDCSVTQIGKYLIFYNISKLYIFDCEKETGIYFSSSTTSVINPTDAYLPTTYISCNPSGGGTPLEAANLMNPFVAEQYCCDSKSLTLKVHFSIYSVYAAYFKNELGEWIQTEVESNTEDTITLKYNPPENYISGEDNVRVVYRRPGSQMKYRYLAGAQCFAKFGVGGFEDRLFISGKDYHNGYVYYSEMGDFTYFPETNYIKVGSDSTKVCALAVKDLVLHVICNDNIYCITGKATQDNDSSMFVNNVVFSITNILKTPMAIKHPPCIFDNEINYLTVEGVCAITPSGILDERCCEVRSLYINELLCNQNLKDIRMLSCGDYLVLANKQGDLYLLDGKQFSVSSDKPFAKRQYEAFVWDNVKAKYVWVDDDRLCFSDGVDIFCFDKNFEVKDSFSDEVSKGVFRHVKAYWETDDIYCDDFYIKKFFMRVGVFLGLLKRSNKLLCNTDVKIYSCIDSGEWKVVKDYDGRHRIFDYSDIDYSRFTYRKKHSDYGIYKRLSRKKGKSIRLRFENDKNEPFAMKGYEIEYLKM